MSTGTDTKQKLITTALDLMWQSSYGSVSVDDICKAANVKKGSFYYFFPSKVDLAVAAMDEDSRRAIELYDKIFSVSIDPLQRFALLAKALYTHQAESATRFGHVCGCPCTSLASEMAGQSNPISAKFEQIELIRKRYFESAIRDLLVEGRLPRSTDPKAKAQEVYNVVLSALVLARIHNDLAPMQTDLVNALQRVLNLDLTAELQR